LFHTKNNNEKKEPYPVILVADRTACRVLSAPLVTRSAGSDVFIFQDGVVVYQQTRSTRFPAVTYAVYRERGDNTRPEYFIKTIRRRGKERSSSGLFTAVASPETSPGVTAPVRLINVPASENVTPFSPT